MRKSKIDQKKSESIGVRYKQAESTTVLNPDERTIEVKFASFGNKDNDNDLLIKGCFAKSIQERGPESSTNRKIAFVWQHDLKDPIGKILKLEEREDGAYAIVKLSEFDAVPNAKRAWSQLNDGSINQFSFGFKYIWDKLEYEEDTDTFIVKEVMLYEVSVVTLGANEQTEYMGEFKSLEDQILELKNKNNKEFEKIKQLVNEAEPISSLTPISMFEKIGSKI